MFPLEGICQKEIDVESVPAYADTGPNHGVVSEVNIDNGFFVLNLRTLNGPVDKYSSRVLYLRSLIRKIL